MQDLREVLHQRRAERRRAALCVVRTPENCARSAESAAACEGVRVPEEAKVNVSESWERAVATRYTRTGERKEKKYSCTSSGKENRSQLQTL
jgi:hypothetical protein